MDYEKTCPVCGKKYIAKRATSVFCSSTCRVKNHFKKKFDEAEMAGVEKAVNQMYIDGNGKEWPSKEAAFADLKERMRKAAEKLKELDS